jgi:hypothetical protein
MTESTDPELLSFTAELLEHQGAAVERKAELLHALLPASLARELDLPGELELGSEQAPLLYGSPLLDRLVSFATRDVPVIYGQIEVPYLKKAGFEQLIGQDIVFADGRVRLTGRAEARTTYLVLICRYLALSDERREGLIEIGVHEGSGALVPAVAELWQDYRPGFFQPGNVPPHFPVNLEQVIESAMESGRLQVEEQLADFLKSMERRLQRDVKNTREYYQALRVEMEASLSQLGLAEGQRGERAAKLDELPREMDRKIADLEQKYRVRVSVTACAAVRLMVDVVQLMMDLAYRKSRRPLKLVWNPLTKHLDPLVCEHCGATTYYIHPAQMHASVQLLCPGCGRNGR